MHHLNDHPNPHRTHLTTVISQALHTLRTLSTVVAIGGAALLAGALLGAVLTYEQHDHAYLASLAAILTALGALAVAALLRALSRLDCILGALLAVMADEIAPRRVRRIS